MTVFSVVLNGEIQKPQIDFLRFCAYAEKRTPENIEKWLKTLSCKTIRLDGTKPIQENVEHIKSLLLWEKGDRASGG